MIRQNSKPWRLACGAALAALSLAGAAQAQVKTFNLPSQPAVKAIPEFARQAGIQIIAPAGQLSGAVTPELRGDLDVRQALQRLIAGTGLEVASDTGTIITLRRSSAAGAESPAPAAQDVAELVVTGSRIRGVAPSSPVMTYRTSDLKDAGYGDLGQLIRSIPQNFAGGQNPGVVAGASGRNLANQNISGGSSLNLRGLGPDATLTLINGRRLSYDGFSQAVDIGAIPIGALDNVQVVTDGASAIYGSDAVAGVANVILKRDMQGMIASARYGAATEGGDETTQAAVAVGDRWSGGGMIVAAQYDHNNPIWTIDRPFTSQITIPFALLPQVSQWTGVISGHQAFGERLELSLDVLGADRRMDSRISYPTAAYATANHVKSYAISPAARLRAPHGWTVDLSGVIASNRDASSSLNYGATGQLLSRSYSCYCNTAQQVEVTGEGPLFSLPGGEARAALGGGYRRNALQAGTTGGEITSKYVYAELNLPVVSADAGLPWVRQLTFNGAVRHEQYDTLGEVTTPKVGLVYSPFEDLQFKASWGKSFKAPTLLQQYQVRYVAVFPANFFDAGIAADRQAFVVGGGSPTLKPEKAETLTVGLIYQPRFLPGLRVETGYFDIDYRDRVIQPIADFSLAFVNPNYAPYVNRSPTMAEILAAQNAAGLLYTLTGPYDPTKVVAIINNSSQNAARQRVRGVDLQARYTTALAGGELTASGNASWLRLSQQNSATAPLVTLSGTAFNAPKFRARAGLAWRTEAVTLAGYVNHQSSLSDVGLIPPARVPGQTTYDLTALYRFHGAGALSDLEVGASVLNLTNEQPPYVRGTVTYVPSFDSTNYSPVGRFVSVSLTKRF